MKSLNTVEYNKKNIQFFELKALLQMNIKNDLTNFHFASRRKILNIVKIAYSTKNDDVKHLAMAFHIKHS